jgi:hypothetical protein
MEALPPEMNSTPPEVPAPSTNDAPKGLPPVAPPSGRFIVQLFLVPGLIVAVAVLILLGFKFLVGGSRSPKDYLQDLDDPNPEVRWRAASDLAQVLQRPESLSLACDPSFGLSLAERLRDALKDLDKEEDNAPKKFQKPGADWQYDAWQYLASRRNYVKYLIACLGNMAVPVGARPLGQVALAEGGNKEITVLRKADQRRQAILALAKLGDNRKRFRQLPSDAAVIRQLEHEAKGSSERAHWAEKSLAYLKDKKPLGVDRVLADCAKADDPFVRKLVAFALKYWDGDMVEPTLVELSVDDGHGTIVNVDKLDEPKESK